MRQLMVSHVGTDIKKMKLTMKEVSDSGNIDTNYTLSLIQDPIQLCNFFSEFYNLPPDTNFSENENTSMMFIDFLEHLNNNRMIYLGKYK